MSSQTEMIGITLENDHMKSIVIPADIPAMIRKFHPGRPVGRRPPMRRVDTCGKEKEPQSR